MIHVAEITETAQVQVLPLCLKLKPSEPATYSMRDYMEAMDHIEALLSTRRISCPRYILKSTTKASNEIYPAAE